MTTSGRDIQMVNGSSITLTGDGTDRLTGRADVLVIQLDPREVECTACGAVHVKAQGLPMRDGDFLENDDPGEWGGFDVCRDCYDAHTVGGVAGLMRRLGSVIGYRRPPAIGWR